jgi:hypothetical protein
MKDPTVDTILIFNLQMIDKSMSNNYKSEGFGIQRFEDDLLGVSTESTKVLTQSSKVFAHLSNLLIQLANVLPQSTYELT